jgi:hypothetical protein
MDSDGQPALREGGGFDTLHHLDAIQSQAVKSGMEVALAPTTEPPSPKASNAYAELADRYRTKGDELVRRANEVRDWCYKRATQFERDGKTVDDYISREESRLNAQFKTLQSADYAEPVYHEVDAESVS